MRCTGRAQADPGRRFPALRDKVYRRDVLERAWVNLRRNGGVAGDELVADLTDGSYRPLAARRVFIPKPGSSEQWPLPIWT